MAACKALILLLALALALTASATSRGESHHLTLPHADDADSSSDGVRHAPQRLLNDTIYRGKGTGTWYYDVHDACGYQQETDGYPQCASFTAGPDQQTLRQTGSNNAIAINSNLVGGDRTKFCGKKIHVYHCGNEVSAPDGGDWFVWDGCDACRQDTIIDFSASGLRNFDSDACNKGVIDGVTWFVTEEQVHNFVN